MHKTKTREGTWRWASYNRCRTEDRGGTSRRLIVPWSGRVATWPARSSTGSRQAFGNCRDDANAGPRTIAMETAQCRQKTGRQGEPFPKSFPAGFRYSSPATHPNLSRQQRYFSDSTAYRRTVNQARTWAASDTHSEGVHSERLAGCSAKVSEGHTGDKGAKRSQNHARRNLSQEESGHS
ncbi:hypothetical protein MRX96_037824 [Rhipicephalus microplus]